MRLPRFTLVSLIGVVVIIALACSALRAGSNAAVRVTLLAVSGALVAATVRAAVHHGSRRAFWVGAALAGDLYLLAALSAGPCTATAPARAVEWIHGMLEGSPGAAVGARALDRRMTVGHSLTALLVATLGGLTGRMLAGLPIAWPNRSRYLVQSLGEKLQRLTLFIRRPKRCRWSIARTLQRRMQWLLTRH